MLFDNISLPRIRFQNPFVWSDPLAQVIPAVLPKPPIHPDLRKLVEQSKIPSKFKIAYGAVPRIMCGNGRALLFEYGDAQFQCRNHDLLEDATLLHPAYTVQNFSLWNKLQGRSTFPIALSMRETPKAPIAGQLYRVTDKTLNDLDYHRDHGVSFVRKIIPIAIPYDQSMVVWTDGSEKRAQSFSSTAFKITNAMVYIGAQERWKAHFNWDRNFYKKNGSDFRLATRLVDNRSNKPFFRFMPKDMGRNNLPTGDLRFFRTRSAYEQEMIFEYDIAEQEDWVNQRRSKVEEREDKAGPSSRLSPMPF